MAEINVDTSSYPKATLPVSPLDIAGKLGSLQQQSNTIQQQQLGISQSKLDQANQALQYLTRAVSAIGPNGSATQYKNAARDAAETFDIPTNMIHLWDNKVDEYAKANNLRGFFDEAINTGQQHSEILSSRVGQQQFVDTGANKMGVRLPIQGQPSTTGFNIPDQPPPTTEVLGPDNQKQLLGNLPPPSIGSNRLQAAPPVPLPAGPMDPSRVPGMRPGERAISAQVQPPIVTGLPPGVGEAETHAGGASGQQLAQDRVRAAAFQRDIFPLAQAIPALETLGTKGTGPGTETFNNIKSFILSNVPGVTEETFNNKVKNFDEAKKYLTDFVNQTGNSGTNDKLAAAFAGNPSVGISNAAAIDVAKSALALRRMQQAVYQEFETQGLPAHRYSQWVAQRMQQTDPRAFGVDLMKDDAKAKLREQLNKNPIEKKRFEESLNLAHNLGFITPSNSK